MYHFSAILRRAQPLFLAIALALAAAGCLTLEQTLTFAKDGSGTVTLDYGVEEALIPALAGSQGAMEKLQGQAAPVPARYRWFFNEALAKETFSGEGIRLREWTTWAKDGRRHVRIVCDLQNMAKGLATGKFGDFTYMKLESGEYLLRAELPPPPEGAKPPDDTRIAELKALCKGLRITLAVECSGRILQAPGAEISGGTARWTLDADKDDAFLRANPKLEARFE